jgi:hypothetical protein
MGILLCAAAALALEGCAQSTILQCRERIWLDVRRGSTVSEEQYRLEHECITDGNVMKSEVCAKLFDRPKPVEAGRLPFATASSRVSLEGSRQN